MEKIEFKVTGKQITDPGWRVIFGQSSADEKTDEEERTLPLFTVGESGPHQPDLNEKWTQPPKPYTEATLLRAMETAGKLVDNDELRDALKENGIGRPSTRAAIIETLFKRRYIRKERKNLIATPTGVELIQIIHEDLLKSAELTGIWEKKLREIERRNYEAKTFLEELKQMVSEIVYKVLSDNTNRRITIEAQPDAAKEIEKKAAQKKARKASAPKKPKAETNSASGQKKISSQPEKKNPEGMPCPLCGKGVIIRGRTAFGCSEWKNGCTYRIPFE